ncbi:MAG: hypothetical protein IKS80_05915 [Bacteroidaceae bacterium]|nr:hypothetical protein [Bacteroidaceae bacterium]
MPDTPVVHREQQKDGSTMGGWTDSGGDAWGSGGGSGGSSMGGWQEGGNPWQ